MNGRIKTEKIGNAHWPTPELAVAHLQSGSCAVNGSWSRGSGIGATMSNMLRLFANNVEFHVNRTWRTMKLKFLINPRHRLSLLHHPFSKAAVVIRLYH